MIGGLGLESPAAVTTFVELSGLLPFISRKNFAFCSTSAALGTPVANFPTASSLRLCFASRL